MEVSTSRWLVHFLLGPVEILSGLPKFNYFKIQIFDKLWDLGAVVPVDKKVSFLPGSVWRLSVHLLTWARFVTRSQNDFNLVHTCALFKAKPQKCFN